MRKGTILKKEEKKTKGGKPFLKIAVDEGEFTNEYNVFEDTPVFESVKKREVGDKLFYKVIKNGDFWNINKVFDAEKGQKLLAKEQKKNNPSADTQERIVRSLCLKCAAEIASLDSTADQLFQKAKKIEGVVGDWLRGEEK